MSPSPDIVLWTRDEYLVLSPCESRAKLTPRVTVFRRCGPWGFIRILKTKIPLVVTIVNDAAVSRLDGRLFYCLWNAISTLVSINWIRCDMAKLHQVHYRHNSLSSRPMTILCEGKLGQPIKMSTVNENVYTRSEEKTTTQWEYFRHPKIYIYFDKLQKTKQGKLSFSLCKKLPRKKALET
jgi:hypothetical protein